MNLSDLLASVTEPESSKEYAEIAKICEEQRRVHILDQVPQQNEALAVTRKVDDLINSGQYEEALPICRELSKEFPKWSRGWILLGNALWLKSEKEENREALKEAKAAYICASRICGKDPTVSKGLGKVAFSERDFELALEFFKFASTSILIYESGYYHENPTIFDWINECEVAISSAKHLNLTSAKV